MRGKQGKRRCLKRPRAKTRTGSIKTTTMHGATERMTGRRKANNVGERRGRVYLYSVLSIPFYTVVTY